jgi:hypothetical protein
LQVGGDWEVEKTIVLLDVTHPHCCVGGAIVSPDIDPGVGLPAAVTFAFTEAVMVLGLKPCVRAVPAPA